MAITNFCDNLKSEVIFMNVIKENCLKIVALVISFLAVFTVNSTCYTLLGQMEEPKSLERLKKY